MFLLGLFCSAALHSHASAAHQQRNISHHSLHQPVNDGLVQDVVHAHLLPLVIQDLAAFASAQGAVEWHAIGCQSSIQAKLVPVEAAYQLCCVRGAMVLLKVDSSVIKWHNHAA